MNQAEGVAGLVEFIPRFRASRAPGFPPNLRAKTRANFVARGVFFFAANEQRCLGNYWPPPPAERLSQSVQLHPLRSLHLVVEHTLLIHSFETMADEPPSNEGGSEPITLRVRDQVRLRADE
jgi:hypothetical protein